MEQDRQMAIDLIEEAVSAGARRFKACEVLEIDVRTLQRWNKTLAEEKRLVDQRKAAASERTPTNKLSDGSRPTVAVRRKSLNVLNCNRTFRIQMWIGLRRPNPKIYAACF